MKTFSKIMVLVCVVGAIYFAYIENLLLANYMIGFAILNKLDVKD